MFSIRRELKTQHLYAYFTIYAGTMEIASFPSPEFTYLNVGQLQSKANPLYGKSSPTFHTALSNDAQNDLCSFIRQYVKTYEQQPERTSRLIPLSVYDTFYSRNNG